tara:strand:+ start:1240 stop:1860 length:621 start_codon:yes stop_codon:yes gene_type:complete
MAKQEKFLLLSLEEDKAKELANAISNETSRKILNYLTEKEASEHKLAKNLKLPASTINYNIKNLLKANLIEVKDFYWSEKGNKINMYQVANKLIVISPKHDVNELKVNIKRILPVALLSFIATGFIYIFTKTKNLVSFGVQAPQKALDSSRGLVAESASITQDTSQTPTEIFQQIIHEPNYALWFFLGSLFVIVVYVLINLIRKKK